MTRSTQKSIKLVLSTTFCYVLHVLLRSVTFCYVLLQSTTGWVPLVSSLSLSLIHPMLVKKTATTRERNRRISSARSSLFSFKRRHSLLWGPFMRQSWLESVWWNKRHAAKRILSDHLECFVWRFIISIFADKPRPQAAFTW